jgi:hypothetical protein
MHKRLNEMISMRIFVFIAVLTFFIPSAFAQNTVMQAEFVGGKEALNKYLKDNLVYPEQAKKDHIEGYFKIALAIDDKGKPIFSDFLTEMKNCEECETEALRLINRMPRWNPKTVNEKPTYSSTIVTIVFELEEGNVKFFDGARMQQDKAEKENVLPGNVGSVK